MQRFTIRQAIPEDAEGIALVGYLAWRWAYSSFLPADFIEQRCNMDRRISVTKLLLAKPDLTIVAVDVDGHVIGVACEHLTPDLGGFDAEIGGLYVAPDAARMGVGRALVREMVHVFQSRGLKSMAIHTLSQNEIGCRFYEKIGGRRHSDATWHGYRSLWFAWDDLDRVTA